MASQKSKDSDNDDKPGPSSEKEKQTEQDKIECAVCLQPCVQPVQLPCKHIFCYLCVKGVTHQTKRCAMCRQEIPSNYLENPCLVSAEPSPVAFEDSHQWFYEGRNGWWQYDQRTSVEIETAYKDDKKQCEVLIAGFLYVIDFENNVQYRRCDPSRRRKIKRDLITAPKKGVAGIRLSLCDDATTNLQSLNLSDSSDTGNDNCCSPSKSSTSPGVSDSSCNSSTVPSKRFKASAKKRPAPTTSAATSPVATPASHQGSQGTNQQSSASLAAPQLCVLPSLQLTLPSFATSVQGGLQPIVINILPGCVAGAQVPASRATGTGLSTVPNDQSGNSAAVNAGAQAANDTSDSTRQANQRKRTWKLSIAFSDNKDDSQK